MKPSPFILVSVLALLGVAMHLYYHGNQNFSFKNNFEREILQASTNYEYVEDSESFQAIEIVDKSDDLEVSLDTVSCEEIINKKCYSVQEPTTREYYPTNTVIPVASDETYTELCKELSSEQDIIATDFKKEELSGPVVYYAYFENQEWEFDGIAEPDRCISEVTCNNNQTYTCN